MSTQVQTTYDSMATVDLATGEARRSEASERVPLLLSLSWDPADQEGGQVGCVCAYVRAYIYNVQRVAECFGFFCRAYLCNWSWTGTWGTEFPHFSDFIPQCLVRCNPRV